MRKLILASLTISSTLAAQAPGGPPRTTPLRGSLERRLAQLLDVPPFERATWGLYVVDDRGRVLYQRNADRLSVPASNTKLVVTAAATVLLAADYRVTTSLYVNGRVDGGVLHCDLGLYGRGDPSWSERCYSVGTLAAGACDSSLKAVDAMVALGDKPSSDNYALPAPLLYGARALAATLLCKGVPIEGVPEGTTD